MASSGNSNAFNKPTGNVDFPLSLGCHRRYRSASPPQVTETDLHGPAGKPVGLFIEWGSGRHTTDEQIEEGNEGEEKQED